MKKKKNTNKLEKTIITLICIIIIVIGSYFNFVRESQSDNPVSRNKVSYEISNIPEYSREIYIEINNNTPQFSNEDMNLEQNYYSELQNKKVRNGHHKNKLEKSK